MTVVPVSRAEACYAHLKELNPYVELHYVTFPLDLTSDLSVLLKYSCVVMVDTPLDLLVKIDEFCRSQEIPIKVSTASFA